MPRRTLLWRIYPYYLIIIFISILAVWLYASRTMEHLFLDRTSSDLESRARLVKSRFADLIKNDSTATLDSLCKRLGRDSDTRITVIAPSGEVLGDSDEDPAQMENHRTRPEIDLAFDGTVTMRERFSNTLQLNMMYVAVPVEADGEIIGVVRTSLPITEVDDALAAFNARIILGGLAITVLATLLSFVILKRISGPLGQLKEGADRFAEGDLLTRLPVPDTEEIGSLAQAMNQMAVHLDERIRTIVKQRNEQEAVLSSMIEGVLAVDADERILNINEAAARLLGIDPESAAGRTVQEAIRNVDLQRFVARSLRSTSPVEQEITILDEREIFLQAHGTVLRDAVSGDIGAVVVLNDLTRLRKLENIRRDFVANVSHELKTPVTSILGFVETLLDGAAEDRQNARRFLEIIIKQANRLNAIIDDLLTLSRIEKESDASEIELRTGRLLPVLNAAIQTCEPRASQKNIRLLAEGDREIETLINARHLEQAVINLIDNAVKYSEPGSEIVVTVQKEGKEAVISVKDHGCGIDQAHLERLFERFYRVDKARSREAGGTGLGLAIVKHIARAHHGRVSVESEPHKGSTFSIHLPL